MSIERLGHHEAARTYLQNADSTRAASAATSGTEAKAGVTRSPDSVSLSDNARSLVNARAAVQQAPDVRDTRVAEIKQRVEDGTYEVPSHVLARKLMQASDN